ncbi:DNA-directed RNA polymerase III subunit RPC4-like isoform X2 [Plodia interpunctella]|uniref:DNA-directed RNA polymerase III subunit RPC4-like isoform X2 n=1 Tax=Plodia interpunctella TaxID=58824 RepID=UPI0023679118|nr:DNA-directed RNA polymerase III subunit RPC4-like isoform X2 [Plodia interpunctella]
MSNPDDRTAKTNGTSDPMQRLASLKPPRDLTLGSNKTNKKIFVPNLNVARNKSKGPQPSTKDQKKDDKGRKDRKSDRNRNNRNGPMVIKSTGVFSEGIGNVEKQHFSRSSYGGGGGGKDSEPTTLKKPTIRIKDFIKIDKELEEQKVKSVLAGDGAYDDDVENFKLGTERDAPVALPMDDAGHHQSKGKQVKVKQEVVVKLEEEDLDCAMDQPKVPASVEVKTDAFDDTDVVNLLRSDKPTLILLQLPDSLPGRGGSDDGPRRHDQPSTSNDDEQQDNPLPRCRLSELAEGRVGALRVRRSGRVALALGDTLFEVCSGTKAAFYQEAVSVSVSEESRSARALALGALRHKLNVVPHWETMFRDLSA